MISYPTHQFYSRSVMYDLTKGLAPNRVSVDLFGGSVRIHSRTTPCQRSMDQTAQRADDMLLCGIKLISLKMHPDYSALPATEFVLALRTTIRGGYHRSISSHSSSL